MSFKVDGRTAFEIPLQEVSQVTSGKNEVTLEFHQGETTPVSLLEMRFYVPPNTGEEGPDPVQVAMATWRHCVDCHLHPLGSGKNLAVVVSELLVAAALFPVCRPFTTR